MKLAKELIRLISEYYDLNKLNTRMDFPTNEEYLNILKPIVVKQFLEPYGYFAGSKCYLTNKGYKVDPFDTKEIVREVSRDLCFEVEIKDIPKDLLTRIDLVIKGSIFLYVNEILSWNEVKKLLNIDSNDVILYKKEVTDNFGAYDIIISLLAVLFGKVVYLTNTPLTYTFKRLITDTYYWDQPMYYYGYKLALSYRNINDILENIDWFLEENPDVQTLGVPDRYDILGMIRINNKFTKHIIEQNDLTSNSINTEMEDLGLYNVALNLSRVDNEWSLGNILFDFYKGVKEVTNYTDDGINFKMIPWTTIRTYSKYINTLMDLDTNYLEIEKIGNILRKIQNFLIH